ncbi:MAG: hypothetical protein HN736_02530 [Anaerolineae bacterium]|jgi:hypothetical protein|nr:hypothetical protein [Anaerolineae bacterium]MBT3714187.1 hypothetical protein [Anaerolineae bacterium]MBT4310390.1 hypothetical protein [Anaerolineae bacterium]MBT4459693.1 hypothetical protein [Anaerolineae bacterium]MBT6063032.1 hypothetical protein [Anaerolineae bacterium]
MKKKISRLWEKAKENRHLLVALGITLTVAIVYYLAWAIPQTFADSTHIGFESGRMDNNMWWASDARDYRDTGDNLFGNTEEETVLYRRPWLYPFIIGFLRNFTPFDPDYSLWAVQFVFWLATIGFTFGGVLRATKKMGLAIFATAIFWTHPSIIALTFHGMTEALNTLLLSIFAFIVLKPRETGEKWAENKDYWLIFLMSLLLVTKPTYQVQLAILLIYILAKSFKKWRILRFWGKISLALIPLWIQLLLSWQILGTPIVSDVAGPTLKYWTVTRVYAKAEDTTATLPEIAEILKDWTTKEEIAYLLNNKKATFSVYFNNLISEGLLADSYFIVNDNNSMNIAIMTLNKWHFYLHLLMLPLMGYLLLFNYKGRWEAIWMIYLTFLIQTLASGVSADQGDRLIITAMPLWIVAYATAFSHQLSLKE